jgi:hypothetical protein
MKVVYIAAPLGAGHDRGANLARAARWVAWATLAHGVAVIADWIILADELAETPANRGRGLESDMALIARCDELWLVGGRISPGMHLESAEAQRLGLTVVDMTALGFEPPTLP